MTRAILEARQLGFTYEGADSLVLEGVNFRIAPGALVFIAGSSGAGKSTLLNIINGLIPEIIEGRLDGELLVAGETNPEIDVRSRILGNVFQNPRSQFFTTNTTAEMVFAMENFGVPKAEMERRVAEAVQRHGIEALMDRSIFELSSGERQLLALVSSLMTDPEVIIFDEPSANLDYGNAMRLRRQLKALKAQGKTVIVADHRCFYLQGMIDQVLLLERHTVSVWSSEAAYFESRYGNRAVDLFTADYAKREISRGRDTAAELEAVTLEPVLESISLTLHRGEVTAIVGVNGVGKTTLAQLIAGVAKPDSGRVSVDGQALYIMQDADYQLFGASCLKELEITCRDESRNLTALKELALYELREAHPHSLSGGQKQRLQMAISKVSENAVIILDEPTSGLDKDSMARVTRMLEAMKHDRAIVVISHDYEFIRAVADRVVYLANRQVRANFYLEASEVERLNGIYKEMEAFYDK